MGYFHTLISNFASVLPKNSMLRTLTLMSSGERHYRERCFPLERKVTKVRSNEQQFYLDVEGEELNGRVRRDFESVVVGTEVNWIAHPPSSGRLTA